MRCNFFLLVEGNCEMHGTLFLDIISSVTATTISSSKTYIPSMSRNKTSFFFWKTSGAELIPKGMRFNLYRPNRLLNVQSCEFSSSRRTCQMTNFVFTSFSCFSLSSAALKRLVAFSRVRSDDSRSSRSLRQASLTPNTIRSWITLSCWSSNSHGLARVLNSGINWSIDSPCCCLHSQDLFTLNTMFFLGFNNP